MMAELTKSMVTKEERMKMDIMRLLDSRWWVIIEGALEEIQHPVGEI